MEEQKLFPIGEVARLFHLSVSSLRHYEAAGLLAPEYVDPSSHYRYYSVRQFEVLNTIRYLRALDMPLAEITAFLKNRDIPVMEEKLRQQKAIVAEKARELRRIERKIDNRLQQLSDAQRSVCGQVRRDRLRPCRIAWVKRPLKIRNALDMEAPIGELEGDRSEAVVFLGKVGVGISAEDLCAVGKIMTKLGIVNPVAEMTVDYAIYMAARASGKPVEFFKGLPPKEGIKLKNLITGFLYGGDGED